MNFKSFQILSLQFGQNYNAASQNFDIDYEIIDIYIRFRLHQKTFNLLENG